MIAARFNALSEEQKLDFVARAFANFRASDFFPILLEWLHQLYVQAEEIYLQPGVDLKLLYMMLGQVRCLKSIYQKLKEPANPGVAASLDASDFSEAGVEVPFPVEEYEPDLDEARGHLFRSAE